MRYLCLIYMSADRDGRLTQAEIDALVRAHFTFDEALRRDGILLHSDALEPPEKASVLRVRDGHLSATDGPFAETKEHLAGFYVIDAPDDAQAARIAARIPSACIGAVELRPVRLLSWPD